MAVRAPAFVAVLSDDPGEVDESWLPDLSTDKNVNRSTAHASFLIIGIQVNSRLRGWTRWNGNGKRLFYYAEAGQRLSRASPNENCTGAKKERLGADSR